MSTTTNRHLQCLFPHVRTHTPYACCQCVSDGQKHLPTTVNTIERGSTSTSAKKCARQTTFERPHKGLCRKFEKPAPGTRAKKLTRLTTPDCYHQGLLHLQSIAQQACYPSVSVGKMLLPATMSKIETTTRSTSCKVVFRLDNN